MDTQDPNLILAAGASHYEDPAIAQARRLQIQQAQQGLQAGAQNMQIGAQDLQAKTYANQQTALDLRDAQLLSDLMKRQVTASSPASPASPAAPGAPGGAPTSSPAGLPVTPEGLVVRDPSYAGPVAGTAAPAAAAAPGAAPASSTPASKSAALDWDAIADELARNGAQAKSIFGIKQMVLGNQEKLATLAKNRADTESTLNKLQDDENDQFAAMARQVQQHDYNPAVALAALKMMADSSPSYAAHAQRIAAALQANPDNLRTIIDSVASHTTAPMLTAQARADTAATSAQKQANEAPKQQAEAQQAQMAATAQKLLTADSPEEYGAMRAALDPDMKALFPAKFDPAAIRQAALTPEQQTVTGLTAARDANTVTNEAAARRQRDIALGLEAQNVGIRRVEADPLGTLGLNPHPPAFAQPGPDGQPLTGDAFLKTLSPGMAAQVKAIAEGRQTNLPRGKELSPLMAAVNQYDPTYTATRGKARAAFTVGKQGQNVQALNTATVHLDQLADAADALRNGIFRPGNAAYNSLAAAFGQPAVTNFDTLKAAVAGEMATALKGNATDQEIHTMTANLQSANSPAQLAGVARTNLHVLGAKLNTYDEQYHATMGKDDPWSPVLPTARGVFQKNGIRPLASDSAPKKNPYR
jgi:hypothetical protein